MADHCVGLDAPRPPDLGQRHLHRKQGRLNHINRGLFANQARMGLVRQQFVYQRPVDILLHGLLAAFDGCPEDRRAAESIRRA